MNKEEKILQKISRLKSISPLDTEYIQRLETELSTLQGVSDTRSYTELFNDVYKFTDILVGMKRLSREQPTPANLDDLLNDLTDKINIYHSFATSNYKNFYDASQIYKILVFLIDFNHYYFIIKGNNYYLDLDPMFEEVKGIHEYSTYYQTFDGLIDLYVSITTESVRDYYMYNIHSINIFRLLQSFNTALIEDKENETTIEPKLIITLPQQQQLTTSSSSSLRSRGGSQIGGNKDVACDGEMVDPSSPLYEGYLVAGITKTYDELLHDFSKKFKQGILFDKIKHYYDKPIQTSIDTFKQNIENDKNITEKNELEKIMSFIDKLHNQTINGDVEWQYYTNSLQYIDEQCQQLDQLTIVKVTDLKNKDFFNTSMIEKLKNEKYIISYEQDPNRTLKTMTSNEDEDGDDNEKDYFYSKIDNTPVEPLFNINDISVRFSDNSTANRKLFPLIYDIPASTDGSRIAPYLDVDAFKNTLYDLKYAPGMLDPKTTGAYNIKIFTDKNKDLILLKDLVSIDRYEQITRLQEIQDISNPNSFTSRRVMIDGINAFIQYFLQYPYNGILIDTQNINTGIELDYIKTGVIDENKVTQVIKGLQPQIGFIENPEYNKKGESLPPKYSGVFFILKDKNIELHVGDTTIDNITSFVYAFDGVIDHSEKPPFTESQINKGWERLYEFGLVIFNLSTINDKNLTEIIISLKSFGDSLQVYYSKRMSLLIKSLEINLNLFISTTDKNVGGESLFLNSPVWVIGTGIRPHSTLQQKYIEFFGETSFKNKFLNIQNNNPLTDEKIVKSKVIITNTSVLDEKKCFVNILDTFKKMIPFISTINISSLNEASIEINGSNIELTSRISLFDNLKQVLSDSNIFNQEGKSHLNILNDNILKSYKKHPDENNTKDELNKELCKLLTDLSIFLKKVYDVIKNYGDDEYSDTIFIEPKRGINNFEIKNQNLKITDPVYKKIYDYIKEYNSSQQQISNPHPIVFPDFIKKPILKTFDEENEKKNFIYDIKKTYFMAITNEQPKINKSTNIDKMLKNLVFNYIKVDDFDYPDELYKNLSPIIKIKIGLNTNEKLPPGDDTELDKDELKIVKKLEKDYETNYKKEQQEKFFNDYIEKINNDANVYIEQKKINNLLDFDKETYIYNNYVKYFNEEKTNPKSTFLDNINEELIKKVDEEPINEEPIEDEDNYGGKKTSLKLITNLNNMSNMLITQFYFTLQNNVNNYDVISKKTAIIKEGIKINKETNISNIISKSLIEFTKLYLNDEYSVVLDEINKQYNKLIDKLATEIETAIEVFNNAIPPPEATRGRTIGLSQNQLFELQKQKEIKRKNEIYKNATLLLNDDKITKYGLLLDKLDTTKQSLILHIKKIVNDITLQTIYTNQINTIDVYSSNSIKDIETVVKSSTEDILPDITEKILNSPTSKVNEKKKYKEIEAKYIKEQKELINYIQQKYKEADVIRNNRDNIYSRELIQVILEGIKENIDKIKLTLNPSNIEIETPTTERGGKRKNQGTKYKNFKKKLRKTKRTKKTKKNQTKKIIRKVSHKFTKKNI